MAAPTHAALQLQSVDSNTTQNGIKCCVYGKAGIGKTRLVLTCPQPLILSCERGMLSVRGHNLPQLPEINSLAELINCLDWCINSPQCAQFNTLFFDSISEAAEIVLKHSKATHKDGRQAHDHTNDQMIWKVFRGFRDIPRKHVVMTAKERYDEDQYTTIKQFKPSMPNARLRLELPHFFDYVFRYCDGINMQTQQPWKALQTSADPTCVAKDRSGKLAMYEHPDMASLFNKAMQ